MNFMGDVVQLLMDHEKDIVMAGLMSAIPLLVALFVVGVFVIVMSRKQGWFGASDRFHRLASILLVIDLALIAMPLAMVSGGMSGSVRRAATIVADHAEDLDLTQPTGGLFLAIALHVYTDGNKNKAAVDELKQHDLDDMRLLAEPEIQKKIVQDIDEETVRAIVRNQVRILGTNEVEVPLWMMDEAMKGAEEGIAASLDMHEDLLARLKPLSDGSLPEEQASDQMGRRFFDAHAADVAERALGSKPLWLGILAFGQYFALFGLLFFLGRNKEADHLS